MAERESACVCVCVHGYTHFNFVLEQTYSFRNRTILHREMGFPLSYIFRQGIGYFQFSCVSDLPSCHVQIIVEKVATLWEPSRDEADVFRGHANFWWLNRAKNFPVLAEDFALL